MIFAGFPHLLGISGETLMAETEINKPFNDQYPHKQGEEANYKKDIPTEFHEISNGFQCWQIIINLIHASSTLCGLITFSTFCEHTRGLFLQNLSQSSGSA